MTADLHTLSGRPAPLVVIRSRLRARAARLRAIAAELPNASPETRARLFAELAALDVQAARDDAQLERAAMPFA